MARTWPVSSALFTFRVLFWPEGEATWDSSSAHISVEVEGEGEGGEDDVPSWMLESRGRRVSERIGQTMEGGASGMGESSSPLGVVNAVEPTRGAAGDIPSEGASDRLVASVPWLLGKAEKSKNSFSSNSEAPSDDVELPALSSPPNPAMSLRGTGGCLGSVAPWKGPKGRSEMSNIGWLRLQSRGLTAKLGC